MGLFGLWEEFVWKKVLTVPEGFGYPVFVFLFGSYFGMLLAAGAVTRVLPPGPEKDGCAPWLILALLLPPLQALVLRLLLSLSRRSTKPAADEVWRTLEQVLVQQEKAGERKEAAQGAGRQSQLALKLDAREKEHLAIVVIRGNGVKEDEVGVEPAEKGCGVEKLCGLLRPVPQCEGNQSGYGVGCDPAPEDRQTKRPREEPAGLDGLAGTAVGNGVEDKVDSSQAEAGCRSLSSEPYPDCVGRDAQDDAGRGVAELVEEARSEHSEVSEKCRVKAEPHEPLDYIRVRHLLLSPAQKIAVVFTSPVWLADFLLNGWRRPFEPGRDEAEYKRNCCYFFGGDLWMFFYAWQASYWTAVLPPFLRLAC